MQHLLCDCPKLQRRRLQYLGRRKIHNCECLNNVPMMISLLRFIKLWADSVNNKMKMFSNKVRKVSLKRRTSQWA